MWAIEPALFFLRTKLIKMKLINLEISNLRKIKAAFFQFSQKGGVTQIVGGNQQAKSTVLDAIMIALFGPKYMETGATTKGEDKTVISCEFDNGYVVKRVFTEKTDRIELNRIIDGKMYPESSPQAFLDGITSIIAIRPIAFLNKSAADKSKIIASCLGINDTLDAANANIKAFEESRASIGRSIKDKGKLGEVVEGLEAKSIKEIQERIDMALEANHRVVNAHNEKFGEWQKEKTEYEFKQSKKEELRTSMNTLREKLEGIQKSIAGIVPEADSLMSDLIGKVAQHLDVHKGAYLQTSYMVEVPKPLDNDKLIKLDPIKAELEGVSEHNLKVLQNQELAEKIAALAAEQKKYDDTALHIEGLKTKRALAISEAAKKVGFPYEVDIVDNDIHINGIESSNWSTSQGLLFALEACRLLNPMLKTICIDNAEAFDQDNRMQVETWAAENDIQTIMTIVQGAPESNDNVYYIEEGVIINTPVIEDAMDSQVPVKEEKPLKLGKKILEIPIAEPVAETVAVPKGMVPNTAFDTPKAETLDAAEVPAVTEEEEW